MVLRTGRIAEGTESSDRRIAGQRTIRGLCGGGRGKLIWWRELQTSVWLSRGRANQT